MTIELRILQSKVAKKEGELEQVRNQQIDVASKKQAHEVKTEKLQRDLKFVAEQVQGSAKEKTQSIVEEAAQGSSTNTGNNVYFM